MDPILNANPPAGLDGVFGNTMDPAMWRKLEDDDDSPLMKVIKSTTSGLAAGTMWGTIVATWYDVPRVERQVALPGLIRALRMMGNYGLTFAAVSGVYVGVEQLVEHYRMKKDFWNGTVGGFVTGATVLGFRGRTMASAVSGGAALAFTSACLDLGDRQMQMDVGKEFYPYTVKKRPSPADNTS